MINFRLKNVTEIVPCGQEPNQTLSWFWLTDGELWLNFENTTIYEYSKEALNHFGNKLTPYNDYYIVRFIEDFTELFEKISETIPERFYELTKNLEGFKDDSKKWLDIYDTDENEYPDFYFDEYYKLISWVNERTLNSGHLNGGPHLSFFRRNDKVKIIWETDYILENGVSLWTAKNGSSEMNYIDFVNQIKKFGEDFFFKMDKQIEVTLSKKFENVQIDKQRLIDEHQERKEFFFTNLKLLEQKQTKKTNWDEIEQTYIRLLEKIK